MVIRLVQDINIHNRRKKIYNYFWNVPSEKRWHSFNDFDNIMFVVAKDSDILELQGLLEHRDFDNKPTIKIIITMLMFSISTIKRQNNQVVKY